MIKKIFSALVVVLFATSMMAQTGLTCNDPIPVDSNYQAHIDGPCEVWYTAYTYDLPLNVYFLPDAENSTWGPEVYVDFTCTPGVYEDENISNLVHSISDFGYDLPIELLCDQVIREGKNAYDLNIGKFYRDQLTEFGINYNVQAFVKVTFFESGRVSLRPDTLFKNCMENSHYIELGDTLSIEANDSESVFVAALPDWKKDSIRFVWDGPEPLRMFFATSECNFTPSTASSYLYKYYDIEAGTPLKMYPDQMSADIDQSKDGGIFYVKMLSNSAGHLVVEKIPMTPPAGNAILLEYDETVNVAANTQSIYAFQKTWDKATAFVSTAEFEMQVSNNHLFDASLSNAFLSTYNSSELDGEYLVGFTSAEMRAMTSKALDQYLYVRFVTSQDASITPQLWEISECVDKTQYIQLNVDVAISSSTSSNVYRLLYEDIQGTNLTIKWNGNARMSTYIGDTCTYAMSSSDDHVIYSKTFTRKGSSTVDVSVVNSWASSVDEYGYLYVRFNPSTNSRVSFSTSKPATPDPVYTTINEVVCDGGTYIWEGTTYATSGAYTKTFVAATGADSIVTLNLTVRPANVPTTEKVSVRYDEPYTWNGTTYTESGSYTVTLSDAYGCDSVATLELTVLEKSDVKPVDNLVLNLASAFKVYSMDHLSWVAQDVTLNWGGSTPLYVFIAKSKDFALTPYNRYVIHYEEIAAGGSWVLTKEQMASWTAHADADGQIYVRFLTEFEGELIVK